MKIHIQQRQTLAMGIPDKEHRSNNASCKERVFSKDKTIANLNNNDKNQSACVNFKGGFFSALGKTEKEFYTSKGFEKFATLTTKPVILESIAAIGFASMLRPATIMAMPGDKRDKQYAAAHGLATGLWGYATAQLIFAPIGKATKNVAKSSEFIKSTKLDKKGREALDAISGYAPKFILRPAEAALTIAFIPLVMKNVFKKTHAAKQQAKMEKKEKSNLSQETKQDINNKNVQSKKIGHRFTSEKSIEVNKTFGSFTKDKGVSFSGSFKELHKIAKKAGGKLDSKGNKQGYLERFQSYLAVFLEKPTEKVMKSEFIQNTAKKLDSDKKIGRLKDFFLSGTALLGTLVYMNRTMKSKEIEPERKKTLAANMAITWALSTAGAMFIDNKVKKAFGNMGEKYTKYNFEEFDNKIKSGSIGSDADLTKFLEKNKDRTINVVKDLEGEKLKEAQKKLKNLGLGHLSDVKEIHVKDLSMKDAASKAKVLDAFKMNKLAKLEFKQGQIGGWAPKVIAFTLIYRFLTPVVATPLADAWKKHFSKDPHHVKQVEAHRAQRTNKKSA